MAVIHDDAAGNVSFTSRPTAEAIMAGYGYMACHILAFSAYAITFAVATWPETAALSSIPPVFYFAMFPGLMIVAHIVGFSFSRSHKAQLRIDSTGWSLGDGRSVTIGEPWNRIRRVRITRDEFGQVTAVRVTGAAAIPNYIQGLRDMDAIAAAFETYAPHASFTTRTVPNPGPLRGMAKIAGLPVASMTAVGLAVWGVWSMLFPG